MLVVLCSGVFRRIAMSENKNKTQYKWTKETCMTLQKIEL